MFNEHQHINHSRTAWAFGSETFLMGFSSTFSTNISGIWSEIPTTFQLPAPAKNIVFCQRSQVVVSTCEDTEFSPAHMVFWWSFPNKKSDELLNLRIVLSPWCFFQTMNVLFNRWWRRRQLSRRPVALFGKRWFWKGCKGVARTGQWG